MKESFDADNQLRNPSLHRNRAAWALSDEFLLWTRTGRNFSTSPSSRRQPASGVFATRAKDCVRKRPRFRVFECVRDDAGQLQSAVEVQPSDAEVVWTVHVINRKAAAPKFEDPTTNGRNLDPSLRRNHAKNTDDLTDPTNNDLIINPGPKPISSVTPESIPLQGAFRARTVTLGQLMTTTTDTRLIFIPGRGECDSKVPASTPLSSAFADSDDWFDDTCDGSVQAEIHFHDARGDKTAAPAWVVSGAYDFAPEIANLVTMYDILVDLAVDRLLLQIPSPIYFDRDVNPILTRVLGYQWVNHQAWLHHGLGHQYDFSSAAMQTQLGDPTSASGSTLRQFIFKHLRPPGAASAPAPFNANKEMPPLWGDNFPTDSHALPLTKYQYAIMQSWSAGTFQPTAPASASEQIP